MRDIEEQLAGIIGKHRLRYLEPIANHTITKTGGPAEWYAETEKEEELIALVRKAYELNLPVYIIGAGSHAQAPEGEIKGLVIKNLCHKFDKMSMKGTIRKNTLGVEEVLVLAESGVIMNQLVRYTIEEGLSGLEYQLGLPGTVGGALITNASYKNKKVRDVLHALRILTKEGDVHFLTNIPQLPEKHHEWQMTEDIILSAIFRLLPEKKEVLWERGNEALEYRSKLKHE